MRVPEVPISGWTRESQYPRFSFVGGQLQVTDRWFVDAADFDHSQLEDIGSRQFGDLVVSQSSAQPDVAAGKVYITIVYSRPTAAGGSIIADGQAEYTLEDGGQEIPIDKRKRDGSFVIADYLANWNHLLLGTTDVAGAPTPAWWATATTLTAGATGYRWAKSIDSKRENERVIEDKTKNAEVVLQPSAVVVERRRYRNYTHAISAKQNVGTRVTPERVFGYTGEWLVVASNIVPEGRRWMVITRYQNAPEWDSDIYAAS